MVQENEPTENSSGDVEAVNIYPACSTKVPVPESNVTEPKTSPAPEPIEPIENMSIPAAAVKSKIAFDELAGLLVSSHPSMSQLFSERIQFYYFR